MIRPILAVLAAGILTAAPAVAYADDTPTGTPTVAPTATAETKASPSTAVETPSPSASADVQSRPGVQIQTTKYRTPGAFCKESEVGSVGYSVNGVRLVCGPSATDNRNRWRGPGEVVIRTPTPVPTRTPTPRPAPTTVTPTPIPTLAPTFAPTPTEVPPAGLADTGVGNVVPVSIGGGVLLFAGIGLTMAARRKGRHAA
jgi:hypothetical protein